SWSRHYKSSSTILKTVHYVCSHSNWTVSPFVICYIYCAYGLYPPSSPSFIDVPALILLSFFFSSRRRHTRLVSDWSSDVCSSDLIAPALIETHGYPKLTSALKQKVFGLNGARVYGIDIPERRRKTEADPIGKIGRASCRERV